MNEMKFENISVLRIYFRYGQKAENLSFWQKMWNNNLGQQLLKKAKELNIEQANIFTAKVGYLNNEKINYNISEIPPNKNPVCLELVDQQEKLKLFIEQHKAELSKVNVILLNNDSFKMTEKKCST
jgi:PII-like signaling protein